MVAPVVALRDRLTERFSLVSALPVTSLFFVIALVLAPALLMGVAMFAGRALAHIATPGRQLFCRFSLALLPVGLTMWGAHVLFHLASAWSTVWPVVQRVADDLHTGWLSTRGWTASTPLFTSDVMLIIQLLLLDAGLLLSLYAGWRIARAYTRRDRDGLLLLIPWAGVATLLYAAGIWIFLQPMQMRGMVHG